MTDQFDTDLRDRLTRIAVAVPVEAPGSTTVVRSRVRSGSVGRRMALGGLVPILAVVVIGTVIAGVAKLGPFAPGSTATPIATGTADLPNGPVIATTSDGPFELTIRSTKARYTADEPIEIEASLAYSGSDPVQISHGQGARGTALGFGIDEPVLGDLRLTPGVLESCERSTLEPGVPLDVAFEKSGGFSGGDPRAAEYRAYFGDPVLRLPVGTWHVYGVAGFSIGNCSPDPVELRVDIEIQVLDRAPTASSAPEPTDALQSVTVRDGDFELTLRSDKTVYAPDEAIGVSASLVYSGPKAEVEIVHDSSGPILFGSRERVYGEVDLNTVSLLMPGWSTLEQNVPVHMPFRKSGGFSGNHPNAEMFKAFMMDPILRLPAGTWHLYAVSSGGASAAPDSEGFALEAEIAIEVSGELVIVPPSSAPIATPMPSIGPDASPGHIQPDGSVLDVVDDGTFELRLEAAASVYLANEPMDISAVYRYIEPEASVDVGKWGPLVGFRIDQLDAIEPTGSVRIIDYAACTTARMTRDVYLESSLVSVQWLSADAAETVWANLDLPDSTLRLPAGSWRITAFFGAPLGICPNDSGEGHSLQASIDITVVP